MEENKGKNVIIECEPFDNENSEQQEIQSYIIKKEKLKEFFDRCDDETKEKFDGSLDDSNQNSSIKFKGNINELMEILKEDKEEMVDISCGSKENSENPIAHYKITKDEWKKFYDECNNDIKQKFECDDKTVKFDGNKDELLKILEEHLGKETENSEEHSNDESKLNNSNADVAQNYQNIPNSIVVKEGVLSKISKLKDSGINFIQKIWSTIKSGLNTVRNKTIGNKDRKDMGIFGRAIYDILDVITSREEYDIGKTPEMYKKENKNNTDYNALYDDAVIKKIEEQNEKFRKSVEQPKTNIIPPSILQDNPNPNVNNREH